MKTPWGYEYKEGKLVANHSDLELLSKAKDMITGGMSLREVSNWLSYKGSTPISHEGLKRRLERGVYANGGSLLGGESSE